MVISMPAAKDLEPTIGRIITARDAARAEILAKAGALLDRAGELGYLSVKVPLTTEEEIELRNLGRAQQALSEAKSAVARVDRDRLEIWDDVKRSLEALEDANKRLRSEVRDADDIAGSVEGIGDLVDAVDVLIRGLILLLARLA